MSNKPLQSGGEKNKLLWIIGAILSISGLCAGYISFLLSSALVSPSPLGELDQSARSASAALETSGDLALALAVSCFVAGAGLIIRAIRVMNYRLFMVIGLLLTGCATTRPPLPVQPDAPTAKDNVADVGKQWDKADQKVAASVSVARENADKPSVVVAETTVALSFLPAPSPEELALARARALAANPKDYATAVDFGKKLLVSIDATWAKVQIDQKEASRVSQLKDARIAELTADIVRVKKEASVNIWSLTGAGLAVIGALATAFLGPRVGIPLMLCGAFCGAVPFIADSPYFMYVAGGTVACLALLLIWYAWDWVRDKVAGKSPP